MESAVLQTPSPPKRACVLHQYHHWSQVSNKETVNCKSESPSEEAAETSRKMLVKGDGLELVGEVTVTFPGKAN